MEASDVVERLRLRGNEVRLSVFDHLHAMLDSPQQPIGVFKFARGVRVKPVRRDQRPNGIQRRRRADGGVTATVDHLLDLDEELDLANSAAATLQIKTG